MLIKHQDAQCLSLAAWFLSKIPCKEAVIGNLLRGNETLVASHCWGPVSIHQRWKVAVLLSEARRADSLVHLHKEDINKPLGASSGWFPIRMMLFNFYGKPQVRDSRQQHPTSCSTPLGD